MSWKNLTRDQKLVTVFAIFTALSHIMFAFGWERQILGINMGVWFVINGIGYIVFLYLPYYDNQFSRNKDVIRYLLIALTLGSIIAWALFHTQAMDIPHYWMLVS